MTTKKIITNFIDLKILIYILWINIKLLCVSAPGPTGSGGYQQNQDQYTEAAGPNDYDYGYGNRHQQGYYGQPQGYHQGYGNPHEQDYYGQPQGYHQGYGNPHQEDYYGQPQGYHQGYDNPHQQDPYLQQGYHSQNPQREYYPPERHYYPQNPSRGYDTVSSAASGASNYGGYYGNNAHHPSQGHPPMRSTYGYQEPMPSPAMSSYYQGPHSRSMYAHPSYHQQPSYDPYYGSSQRAPPPYHQLSPSFHPSYPSAPHGPVPQKRSRRIVDIFKSAYCRSRNPKDCPKEPPPLVPLTDVTFQLRDGLVWDRRTETQLPRFFMEFPNPNKVNLQKLNNVCAGGESKDLAGEPPDYPRIDLDAAMNLMRELADLGKFCMYDFKINHTIDEVCDVMIGNLVVMANVKRTSYLAKTMYAVGAYFIGSLIGVFVPPLGGAIVAPAILYGLYTATRIAFNSIEKSSYYG